MNLVILEGTVGKDPDIKEFGEGKLAANINVATNEYYTDKEGEKRQNTEWHRVVFYDTSAEVIRDRVQKGTRILIKGKLRSRKYEKDGSSHSVTEVVSQWFEITNKAKQRDEYQKDEDELDF